MVQRSGEAVIRLPSNVRQKTIKPLILQTVAAGTLMYTDEYPIYGCLPEWGYGHKTVNHSKGEHARDEDGDGFHKAGAGSGSGGSSGDSPPLYATPTGVGSGGSPVADPPPTSSPSSGAGWHQGRPVVFVIGLHFFEWCLPRVYA